MVLSIFNQWRFTVYILSLFRNRKFISLITLVVFMSIFASVSSAVTTNIDQAKRAKIDMNIRIVAEQIKRGLFQQAESRLASLQTSEEFSTYISERQYQEIAELQAQIDGVLKEREKIARALKQSDTLSEQGKYKDALDLLNQIKNSKFASESEQKMIQDSYDQVASKYRTEQQKWQMLFDQSVAAYNNGQPAYARQGFVQLIESGYPVQGDKTPQQYILLIDTNASRAAVPVK